MVVPHMRLYGLTGVGNLQATWPRALEYYMGQILKAKKNVMKGETTWLRVENKRRGDISLNAKIFYVQFLLI